MTDTKTPGTEPDNNEGLKQPSDARIILGPLVKYAAMGFVIVSIIITTVVMVDRQFNDIDREVAELEAQLDAMLTPLQQMIEMNGHAVGLLGKILQ